METKSALVKRLTLEGRLDDAIAFRDCVVKDLVAKGIKPLPVAKQAAWVKMQQAFPKLSAQDSQLSEESEPDEEDESDSPDELPSDMPTGSTNFDEDLAWAYNNLGSNVTAKDAPSGAAWILREHGRTLKTRGAFVTMAQKAFSTKGSEDIEKMREDRSRQFKLLSTLSREFAGL